MTPIIIENFFNKEKQCPSEIYNCENLRNEYFKQLNFLLKTNCLDCDISFLKSSFIKRIKKLDKNKIKKLKKYNLKNKIKPKKFTIFSYCKARKAFICFYDNLIYFLSINYVAVYKIIFKFNLKNYMFMIYLNTSKNYFCVFFDTITRKEIFSLKLL